MARVLLFAAGAVLVVARAADADARELASVDVARELQTTCSFTRSPDACSVQGTGCTQSLLCSSGLYCQASTYSASPAVTYTGKCAKGPTLEAKYQQVCDVSAGPTQCQFQDPLALTPYSVSALQCIPPSKSSFAGQCLLGPQKHGDGCSVPQECASGTCLKELRMCRGTDEGEACTPGLPDACQPAHYCAGGAGGDASMGTCAKSVSPGGRCAYPTACASGTFCTGPDASFTRARCAAAFTVDTGANTTIGPYMCKTGNAIMVAQGATLATSVYTCVTANSTRVGEPCVAARGAPPGYQCRCAEDGTTRLRTVGALGLGGRSAAWRDLYTCLLGATGPTGDPCLFDSADLETVRYGSCVYYACYPQYLALVNATGGRTFAPPLSQFEPTAPCEKAAAADYYNAVAAAPCIQIPHLENWKCASRAPPASMSVENTSGLIAFIFLLMIGGYSYHGYYFHKGMKLTHPKKSHKYAEYW